MPETPTWPFLGRGGISPVRVVHSEGCYFHTDDGRKILDAAGGSIVVNVGHGRKDVAEAIRAAAAGNTYAMATWPTPERESLVDELRTHWLPSHLDRIHLVSGGSEGIEAAIKMAVQYHAARGKTEKTRILGRSLSYHGTTIFAAGLSGHAGRKRGLERFLGRFDTVETPYPLRFPHGRDACDHYILDLRNTIRRIGAENIAAFVAEPVCGASGGAIVPPPGYWKRANEILKANDILLIMDEVMTGFGRLGEKFAVDMYGIEPDLMVSGKGMASGYAAISGVYGTDEIAGTIDDASFDVMFHSFSGLQVSCAASTEVLRILREESLVENAKEKGDSLKEMLIGTLGRHPNVAEIRGEGLLIGVEIVENRDTLCRFRAEESMTRRIVEDALGNGVFFYPGGTGDFRDIICIGPSFTIGDGEIDKIVEVLSSTIDRVVR